MDGTCNLTTIPYLAWSDGLCAVRFDFLLNLKLKKIFNLKSLLTRSCCPKQPPRRYKQTFFLIRHKSREKEEEEEECGRVVRTQDVESGDQSSSDYLAGVVSR